FFDYGQDRLGQWRAIGAQYELDLVLINQALDELGGASRRRFIIVIFDRQVIAFVADLDAAGVVDFFDREIIAVLGIHAIGGIDAGRRNGGPKDEVLTCLRLYGRGRTREDRRNHGCKSCAAEHWFLPPIESLASPAWLAPELVILSITRIFEGTID